jgi:hypothetical protein
MQTVASPITDMIATNLVVITSSVEKRSDCSQFIYDESGNVIETHGREERGSKASDSSGFIGSLWAIVS